MKEKSLVAYTLLAQTAVGGFIFLEVLVFVWRPYAGESYALGLRARVLAGLLPLIWLAVLASLFHLGSPENAWRALRNLRTSWLSREVLFTLLFALGETLLFWLSWQRGGSPGANLLAAFTALCGLCLLYSMSRLYMLPAIPGWNTWATPVAFLASAGLLGALALAALLAANPVSALLPGLPASSPPGRMSLLAFSFRELFSFALIFWLVEFALLPLAARRSPFARALRPRLILAGAAAFLMLLFQALPVQAVSLLLGAFAAALCSQIIARFRFYREPGQRPL